MANRPGVVNIPQDLDRAIQEAVVRGELSIPPYPAVAMRIQDLVARREYGLGDLSKVVASDPVLTADVLRCANSMIYRRGDSVAGLGQAITRIGAQEVARLALSSGLAVHAQAPGSLAALKRATWIDGVASAVLCQVLARQRGLRAEEAFVLGLLHDFGTVVITSAVEGLIQAKGFGPRPIEDWRALVERHHVAAGTAVAERWGLPGLVREIIQLHHVPEGAGCSDPALMALVRGSDQVVGLMGQLPTIEAADLAAAPDIAAGERELVVKVIERIPSFVAAFEGPSPPPPQVPSAVAPPLTTLGAGERQVTFGVQVTHERRPRTYVAVAVSQGGLVLLGSEPLPERQLVELDLQCQPKPFKVWSTIQACRPEGSGLRVDAKLFGLGGDARALWTQLYAVAQRPG